MGCRILMLLADEYRPDPRVRKEALALIEDGINVTILSWDRGHHHESRSEKEGLKIECVRTGKVYGLLKLGLNYPRFFLKAFGSSRKMDFDSVHAHDLDTLLLGVAISRLKGVPLVYDAHEHYAAMVAGDVPRFFVKVFDRLEAWALRYVDLLVTANSKIEEYLLPHLRSPRVNSVVVMNCIDYVDPTPTHKDHDGIIVFYSGSLESTRYVEDIALATLDIEDCIFKVAGDGPLRPRIEELSKTQDRIIFLGYVPHQELLESMIDIDLVACLMDPSNENNKIGTPNKLFESMVFGIPVLVSEGTLSAEIALEERCGIAINWSEGDFKEAVEMIRDSRMRREMGDNGRRAAREKYNWGIMKKRLVDAYRSLSQ